MLGGARIVRFVVLQESKITASATAPPAPHRKVSRLLCTHRVTLESHTNREYAQKQKIISTHFFGPFLPDRNGILPMPADHRFGSAELRRRFPGQFLENAIKL